MNDLQAQEGELTRKAMKKLICEHSKDSFINNDSTIRFDDNRNHVWIDGKQYISLNRFLDIQRDLNTETELLRKQVDQLIKENQAYKILLKEQLNRKEG